jgi:hypothetical protein
VRFLSPIVLPAIPEAPQEEAATVGGAVRLGSRRYITRKADADFLRAIGRRDSIVLVKGARQMGKTSLLARGAQEAREAGAKVVWTDLQSFSKEEMASAEAFLKKMARRLAGELELNISVSECWDPELSPNNNLDDFLKRHVLRAFDEAFVWAIDELDRIFGRSYSDDVCGLFRSWHNQRAGDPNGPWYRLTLALSHSTEPHLFIADAAQSPFNVGTQVALTDFLPEQTAELNAAYGEPIRSNTELARFHSLINGHPYLASKGLYEMQEHGLGYATLESQADQDAGPFGDHLRRVRALLARSEESVAAVQAVLRDQPCPTVDIFYRLRSAGILRGNSEKQAKLRCPLYETYLARTL